MFRCLLWAIAAAIQPKVLLIADNLCLRQQLLILQRRKPRPRFKDADRRFWILACQWFDASRTSVLIVKPETVLRWHRREWRMYWRERSGGKGKTGRPPIASELRTLIRRMTVENRLWGQRGIQAELARLGFKPELLSLRGFRRNSRRRGTAPRATAPSAQFFRLVRWRWLGWRRLLCAWRQGDMRLAEDGRHRGCGNGANEL
jgi:hypothetical protein